VVTVAPDGSWGVATEAYIYQAIAKAVSNCRKMSGPKIGCGAQFTVIRAGWTIALRCANTNIIVAEPSVAAAERAIADRTIALRQMSSRAEPACARLTVDPSGVVIPFASNRPGIAASTPD
jgi:hypothetical protein